MLKTRRKLIANGVSVSLIAIGLLFLMTSLPAPHLKSSRSSQPIQFLTTSTQLPMAVAQQFDVAQRFDIDNAWRQVYEQLPDLPLENQYVSQETGDVAQENTLISRLIRYHIYTQGRPPQFRLDWKLTLADYLGVNERMVASAYPSADTLDINPMQGDVAAIQSLDRAQRDALVQILVNIFAPEFTTTETTEPPADSLSQPTPSTNSPNDREPQPGDAELLLPQ
ncbi:MAG: hypothetical protein HC769_13695 [Cyanobacteria bacterium CRU_2_1]|nr:hypothetical protein [Cyanobacteria bacterium RU_5_0]NJR59794.1 hypothetical protein [Cyanobacteria bacterium CRU_2_1]